MEVDDRIYQDVYERSHEVYSGNSSFIALFTNLEGSSKKIYLTSDLVQEIGRPFKSFR